MIEWCQVMKQFFSEKNAGLVAHKKLDIQNQYYVAATKLYMQHFLGLLLSLCVISKEGY